jgi:biopolymer transport protein TolR
MGAKLGGGGRSGHGRGRSKAVMSEINVTPLVDVMLVLLIIFMITAPLLTAGVAVDLPKAHAKAIGQQDNTPLEVNVDSKGNVFIGDTAVKLDALKIKLTAIAIEAPDRRVYIKADQRLAYGKIMEVMTTVSTAGFTKIALITDPATAKKN